MQRTCIKCGQVNLSATGSDIEECPGCGAIYAKAVAAARPPAANARRASAEQASGFGHTRPLAATADPSMSRAVFVDQMRADSLYPTFRGFAQVGYIIGLVVAGLLALGAVGVFFKQGPIWAAAVFALALFVWLAARAIKETSLMLADMSDAMVRLAAKQGG